MVASMVGKQTPDGSFFLGWKTKENGKKNH